MSHAKRNDPCPCGSGKKYKKCCYGKDQSKIKTAKILSPDGGMQKIISSMRESMTEQYSNIGAWKIPKFGPASDVETPSEEDSAEESKKSDEANKSP